MNIYIPIEPIWAYNFIGGLNGCFDLDHKTQSELYAHALSYIHIKHNFIIDKDAKYFNKWYEELIMCLQYYPVDTVYFEIYFGMLFRDLKTALDQIPQKIKSIQTFCNDTGDLTGIIVTV